MNAMNSNSNIDEEEAKINTMLFELNSNKSIITENIIDLSNIYNKLKLIREKYLSRNSLPYLITNSPLSGSYL